MAPVPDEALSQGLAQNDPASLVYPLKITPPIGEGTAVEIAPRVYWLRMPLGLELGYINVWALEDDDGWSLVDTGLRTPQTVEAWHRAFAHTLGEKPIQRILVTHLHPDHSGMAGWLANRTGARLWMTRLEYLTLRVLVNDIGREAPVEGLSFYRAAGWSEPALDRYRTRFGDFGKMVYPIPNAYQCMMDGDRIMIAGQEWQVVVGVGHSPEHACLYCPTLKLLIAGDQVLPTISSNISVQPLEPEADPLTDWLTTLATVRDRVPEDTLVLPAHGDPFLGLHQRIDQLLSGHERSLVRLAEALAQPKRAVDIFSVLFRRPITPELQSMATGESLAHLHCLRHRGIAQRHTDADGIAWWSRAC
ncbi:MBL fold metallo-hydrolase [Sphingobium sp. HBC34]|uniref:MBL fold metallo-hydrolase n=1 Tax=Sphingobium cyanobacteriorum TaxID=3063954 RepID=A0ABT8ZPH8_9SPHN|nr:MBL fold metallo-hydrolase [Sphingobium sp. HBC34]MDO7836420.1 MBL fold metallo-hydrolase [Sphingobium sp. HBC34]